MNISGLNEVQEDLPPWILIFCVKENKVCKARVSIILESMEMQLENSFSQHEHEYSNLKFDAILISYWNIQIIWVG